MAIMNPTPDAPITVANVTAVSYSGATWLTLMLGAHSKVFGAGEIGEFRGKRRSLKCAVHGDACPVWRGFDESSAENAFRQLARLSGKRVIATSHSNSFLPDQQTPNIQSRFIHMVRDGRPVVASYLRKHPGKSTWKAVRWWKRRQERSLELVATFPPEHVLRVRYEALNQNTEQELRRIFAFLGLEFEPGTLEYWNGDQHYIGGNLGTLSGMLRLTQRDVQGDMAAAYQKKGRDWDTKFYEQADTKKFSDERWKKELSRFQLWLFDKVGGKLNASQGYPRRGV